MYTIEWDEIYNQWKLEVKRKAPELLGPVKFEHIKFKFNHPTLRIYGYDWIHKDNYDERISFVTGDPTGFLISGSSLNKGTLQTAEYLVKVDDDSELLAAIWIYAFIFDLRNKHVNLLDNRRQVNAIKNGVIRKLIEENIRWHHSMRMLLPADYFTYLYHDLKGDHYETFIELAVITAKSIYHDYTITLYESYRKED